ncbi:hypothetical protein [Roseomonas populi]|uniref:4-oxalocrotonate decarboxylase n=1 Tax=Roseomonas populi TaxID=3121582 RepID=A0ABT1X650_9PROT|nr:hypothetical protein [Roseomonas pecuniae]MCR0983560.1 hypothetical protein [Roseomonas pecuniae]
MTRAARAASWLAEALSTGRPLAALPPDVAPRGRAEGERVALAVLDALGIVPCGLRMLHGTIGPMIETRLLPSGATAAPLRHPVATGALVGVLAEVLRPDEDSRPRLAALHAAIDISDHRFTHAPEARGARVADLNGLGFVVAGPPMDDPPEQIALEGRTLRVRDVLAPVAAEARRLGGLPAGALLVAAGLTGPLPADDGAVAADFGPAGRISARIA